VLDEQVDAVLAAYPALHAAWRRRGGRGSRERASGRRLSDHQAGILEHLDPAVAITVGELARLTGVTPATISIQLARLVRLRLVARDRDPRDARRVLVRLSEAGLKIRSHRSVLDPDKVRAALTRLEPLDRDTAVSGLRTLARAAKELAGPRAARTSPRRPRRAPE
jgi:DNA-binding MarR family transcriptional regulator